MEERAKVAAHVRDSVLQTLTLIEKAVQNPADVMRLARAQERELRQRLFAPEPGVAPEGVNDTFAQQLRRVESDYGVIIELVVVGDCPADEHVTALANAAKWARVPRISIYGEVEPSGISVYVRDTGVGFDPTTVADDRHDIAQSIAGRMSSHGGEATISSVVGDGTEVHLSMSRASVDS